jgi:hypothetical protein
MKKLWPLLLIIAAGSLWYLREPAEVAPVGAELRGTVASDVEALFERRESNAQVRGAGTVLRTLSDDDEGSRHQRFILELASGHTLLISHNIDLAPRIEALKKGDRVEFFGEYEWNDKGGVVHWTHDDPQGQHDAGWLKHDGHMYQ